MKLIPRRRRDELSNWSPLNHLGRLREEVNRLFESPFSEWSRGSEFFGEWTPSVDLLDTKDKLTVKAELPGLKKEDIDISLDGNNLTIAGERRHEDERKEGGHGCRSTDGSLIELLPGRRAPGGESALPSDVASR